jgi:lipopolysaccharide export system ATP-binding protein
MSGLQASGLSYTYGQRRVLDDVSIEVSPGEIVGLLGPNGAGKTTVFKLLAGLLVQKSASIRINDRRIDGMRLWTRAQHGLTYIPQRSTVIGDLTVAENIEFGLAQKSSADREASRRQISESFGLSHLTNTKGRNLSGGERRRVELARAFATKPAILLADEPFAALDPLAMAEVSKLLAGFCSQGVGVLLTDHNVAQALALCDRVYILFEGKVICTGSPEEVAENPKVRDTYLGERFAGTESCFEYTVYDRDL